MPSKPNSYAAGECFLAGQLGMGYELNAAAGSRQQLLKRRVAIGEGLPAKIVALQCPQIDGAHEFEASHIPFG